MKWTALILGLCLAAAVQAQDFDRAKMDSLFARIERNQKAMGSLSLMHKGQVVYQKQFGYKDWAAKAAPDAQTKYRIGSISKTFTAVIIMQLVEQGKLKLNTKLSKFFPKVPNAKKITVEHLLRHRSGIFNFTDNPEYARTWMHRPHSQAELLELISQPKPQFGPGTKEEYSNSGYVLLTWIAEKVENKPFAQILEERIIKPCGLKLIHYGQAIEPKNNEAKSYNAQGGGWIEATVTDMSLPLGAGAISATPEELNRFFLALFQEKLLKKSSLELMQQTASDGMMGIGLFPFPFYNRRAYGHTGGIDGFQSNAGYFAKDDLALALTLNGASMPMNDIMIGVLSIYFGTKYELPEFKPSLTVDEATLNRYVGTYAAPTFPLKISIFVEKGVLMGQATGQSSFPLDCIEPHVFVFEMAKLRMAFNPEAGTMRFQQGGVDLEMSRETEK